jgi:CheY-like chemotaxis protein
MKILFLDDDYNRTHFFKKHLPSIDAEYSYAETAEEAIDLLDNSAAQFEVVFLDHDLGGKIFVKEIEGTGYEVALHIVDMPSDKKPYQVILHSHNPVGVQRMHKALKGHVKKIDIIPWSDLVNQLPKSRK